MLKCPICKSKNINQYRQPVGEVWCVNCGFSSPKKEIYNPFKIEESENYTKQIIYVKFLGENGYDHQPKDAIEKGLKINHIYNLEDMNVGGWSSEIKLYEFEETFNSVMFEYFNEDFEQVDIFETEYNNFNRRYK